MKSMYISIKQAPGLHHICFILEHSFSLVEGCENGSILFGVAVFWLSFPADHLALIHTPSCVSLSSKQNPSEVI